MSALYEARLLEHARREAPPIPDEPTHVASLSNPLCGDLVRVGARVVDGRVHAFGFEADGCAICRAGAAWLASRMTHAPLERFEDHMAELESAIRGEAETGDVTMFAGLHAHPSRHGCALLPWRAFERALLGDAARPRLENVSAPPVGDDPWEVAAHLRATGAPAAMATLVSVVGSSPCPVGSRMVITGAGHFVGSVSGGCVESAVVQTALRVLAGEPPSVHAFQISNSAAGEVGLACGGRIRVHVARALEPERSAGSAEVRVLDLETGAVREVARATLDGPLARAADAALSGDASRAILTEGEAHLVEALRPEHTLFLVGATHVAQRLARLAAEVGLTPVVIDPRAALLTEARFGHTERVVAAPADVLAKRLDGRSSVVTLTHEARLDDPALRVALASDALYVGALGSRKTQRGRLARLRAAGVPEAQLARLRGPAGLPIGGIGAAEIALSILAEIVAARRRPRPRARVAALVLAAGSSRRAGDTNKLLLDVDGEPMIRGVVRAVRAAGVARCVVVLGHQADRVREALRDEPVELVMNDRYASGMGASIARGVGALGDDVDAALIALGDMPFVQERDIRAVLDAHRPSTAHLVIAPEIEVDGERRRGHPVLWPRRYFDALAALDGDEGGRAILRDAPGALMTVAASDAGVLRDVDRPD